MKCNLLKQSSTNNSQSKLFTPIRNLHLSQPIKVELQPMRPKKKKLYISGQSWLWHVNLTLVKSPTRTCPIGIYDYCFMGAHYFTFKCRIWFQKSGFNLFWWKLGWIGLVIRPAHHLTFIFFSTLHTGLLHLKFIYSPPYFWLALHRTKLRWRFLKILWPSQNIWTLKIVIYWIKCCLKGHTTKPLTALNWSTFC